MALIFPNQILLVEGVQIRLLSSFPPQTVSLNPGVTPYIPFTQIPKFSWVSQGVEGYGPLSFKIEITWIGNGLNVPEKEIDETGILTQSYVVPRFNKLQHISDKDAGGEYQIIVIASQSSSPDIQIGGRFRINYKPNPPINLIIT